MENNNHYLYAIVVENSIWGELSVCKGNHYEIHAIGVESDKSEEDTVSSYIWELKCECADGYGSPEQDNCNNCGAEEDACECGDRDCEEEDYGDFVERESSARWVKYDPTNIDHVLCNGAESYRDTVERDAILLKKARENKAREIGRANSKINALEDELFKLRQAQAKLEKEFMELK
jgi:hypothetical protein